MLPRPAATKAVVALLLAAGLARVALALLGGQHYFGDELRYYRGSFATIVLFGGKTEALADFGTSAAHTGFSILSAGLAPVHWFMAWLAGIRAGDAFTPIWVSPQIGAALLGLFSTLNLWLLYRVARRAGAEREESLWAMLCAAGSLSLLVYSRHLLPYDASLTFFLASVLVGLGRMGWRRAALSGAAAGFAFTVYNGHWALLPLTAVILAVVRWRRCALSGGLVLSWMAGGALGLALGYLPALVLGHGVLLQGVGRFADTVRHGDYAEGWSLPWEFLWHAESWPGAVVLLLALWGGLHPRAPARARACLAAAAAIYLALLVMSAGWEKFVVYARTVRPLVPLICLAAGSGLAALLARFPRWKIPAALALALGSALNSVPLFPQKYPVDLDREIHRLVGVPTEYLTFLGSWDKRDHPPVTRPDLVLVNSYALYGFIRHRDYPAGEVLLDVPHPLALRFYQYDGHLPAQRALLRAHEPRIKLIRLSKPRPAG